MRIENNTKQADLQYWYPENLKDIKKLVRMAKEVNSYNKTLQQYLKVYKNEYLETIEYLTNKDENYLLNEDEWGNTILDSIMLRYYKNSPKDNILTID